MCALGITPMLRSSVPPMSFSWAPKTCSTVPVPSPSSRCPAARASSASCPVTALRLMIMLLYPSSSNISSISPERYALSAHTFAACCPGPGSLRSSGCRHRRFGHRVASYQLVPAGRERGSCIRNSSPRPSFVRRASKSVLRQPVRRTLGPSLEAPLQPGSAHPPPCGCVASAPPRSKRPRSGGSLRFVTPRPHEYAVNLSNSSSTIPACASRSRTAIPSWRPASGPEARGPGTHERQPVNRSRARAPRRTDCATHPGRMALNASTPRPKACARPRTCAPSSACAKASPHWPEILPGHQRSIIRQVPAPLRLKLSRHPRPPVRKGQLSLVLVCVPSFATPVFKRFGCSTHATLPISHMALLSPASPPIAQIGVTTERRILIEVRTSRKTGYSH